MILFLFAILSVVLLTVEYKITAPNYGVKWNGMGSITQVLHGQSLLPMQHRVLIPYLSWLFGFQQYGKYKLRIYQLVKYLGFFFALNAFHYYLQCLSMNALLGTIILATFLPLTFKFDYADCYYELATFALSFALVISGGSIWYLIPLVIIHSLNRETWVFIPLYTLLNGMYGITIILTVTGGLIMLLIYLLYGQPNRYCPFNFIKENILRFKKKTMRFEYLTVFTIIFSFAFLSIFRWSQSEQLQSLIITIWLFTGLMVIPSIWAELRVWIPLTLVMIPLGML